MAIVYQLSRPTNHSAGSENIVAGSRMAVAGGIHNPKFKVNIKTDGDVKCYMDTNETWQNIGIGELTFPDYIVGYSSGLNENLQRAFLKNAVQYFDVMNTKLKWRKELSGELNDIQMVEVNEKYLTRYPHIFDAPTGEALEQDGTNAQKLNVGVQSKARPVNANTLKRKEWALWEQKVFSAINAVDKSAFWAQLEFSNEQGEEGGEYIIQGI